MGAAVLGPEEEEAEEDVGEEGMPRGGEGGVHCRGRSGSDQAARGGGVNGRSLGGEDEFLCDGQGYLLRVLSTEAEKLPQDISQVDRFFGRLRSRGSGVCGDELR
eukprot:GCRY01008346.1.p2 GENE.GCRY01008346.1~~GCRY01008346.1.p2  ORF type:complete len:105 (-),score=16.61 GCRY01008346.1:750-1064(-)